MNKISMVFIFSLLWCTSAFALQAGAEVENNQTKNNLHPDIASFLVTGAVEEISTISEDEAFCLQDMTITTLYELKEDDRWFDANLVKNVSIVTQETEEASSLLSGVLNFLLIWLIVGMLTTPFVLRLRMY